MHIDLFKQEVKISLRISLLLQLEEEKRRQKIEMWENMKQGKSTKGNSKIAQVRFSLCNDLYCLNELSDAWSHLMKPSVILQSTEEASTSTSTLKPKTEKKALRESGMLVPEMRTVIFKHKGNVCQFFSYSKCCKQYSKRIISHAYFFCFIHANRHTVFLDSHV